MKRRITAIVVVILLAAGTAAPAQETPSLAVVSVDGPRVLAPGQSAMYSGSVALEGVGVPAQPVEIFIEGGEVIGTATTDTNGDYAVAVSFPAAGTVTLRAALMTPVGGIRLSQSPPITVEVSADPDAALSSSALIKRAFSAGRIGYGTSLLYRAYAAFADPRLPAEYVGADSGHDSGLFSDIAAASDTLTAAEAAALEPFTVRPADPRSVYSESSGAGGAARTDIPMRAAAAAPERCTPGFAEVSSLRIPVTVWSCQTGNYLSEMTRTLALVEQLWNPMTAYMRTPLTDDGGPSKAGNPNENIDIYLVEPLQKIDRDGMSKTVGPGVGGATSITTPKVADGHAKSAYIMLNRWHWTHNGAENIKRYLVHELFHAQQLAYTEELYFVGILPFYHQNWFLDASAVWAETAFARDSSKLTHSDEVFRLDTAKSLNARAPVNQPYGAYRWPLFLEQEKGRATIAEIWSELRTAEDDEDVMAVLHKKLSFEDNFGRFALRNLNLDLPGDPLAPRWQTVDGNYPDNLWPPFNKVLWDAAAEPLSMPPLSARYYKLDEKEIAASRRLTFDISGLGPAHSLEAYVVRHTTAGSVDGEAWHQPELITGGRRVICMDFEAVDDAYLVLANRSQQTTVSGTLKIERSAEGCGASGTITYRHWRIRGGAGYDEETTDTATISPTFRSDDEGGWLADGGPWSATRSLSMNKYDPKCTVIISQDGSGSGSFAPGDTPPRATMSSGPSAFGLSFEVTFEGTSTVDTSACPGGGKTTRPATLQVDGAISGTASRTAGGLIVIDFNSKRPSDDPLDPTYDTNPTYEIVVTGLMYVRPGD